MDPTGYFKSNCRMDVTWFPFDTHSCDLNFYSWGYYATHLNITLEDMQVLDALFVDNGEWMLQDYRVWRWEQQFPGFDQPFATLTLRLIIKRVSTSYAFNLIVPVAVLSVLSVMTFYLPAGCEEKIGLG